MIRILGLWLVLGMVAGGTEIRWRMSTPLPDSRAGYSAGVVDGRLVIAGGTYWEGSKGNWVRKIFSARVDAFDPVSEKWTRLADLPVALAYAASTVVDGRMYVVGGTDGKAARREVFVLEKGSWRRGPDLPGPKVFAKAVTLGKRVAVVGGMTRFEPYDSAGTCCTSLSASNELLFFDGKGWTAGAPYPGPARWIWTVEGDGKALWLIGGMHLTKKNGPVTRFPQVLRYDGVWTKAGELPGEVMATQSVTSAMLGRSILLISFAKKVWELNLAPFGLTERAPLPEEAIPDGFFRIGNKVVASGGENKIEGPRRRSEWTFIGEMR